MTERLYYADSYLTGFSARVVSRSGDGLRVVLDRTAFYPTSGGQPFDTGTLGGARVIDVIDEESQVVHVLSAPLQQGDAVDGGVDWTRRFDHMQQHTGQHVLSAVLEDLFGFRTASVHFGNDSSSVDLETPQVSPQQLLEAEARVNAIIFANHPVAVSFENAATAEGLRKPPPREGELRVITITGVDRSACGGTHVRATGEIGLTLLRKQDRMHGNARIEFVCGGRALRHARADYDALSGASASLGVGLHEVAGRSRALQDDFRAAERARKKLAEELAAFQARDAYASAQPDDRGVRWILVQAETGSLDDLRPMAQAAMALERCAFAGVLGSPPQLLLATSGDSGLDAGKMLKAALADVGGRGGGSPRLAQGSVPAESVGQVLGRLGVAAKQAMPAHLRGRGVVLPSTLGPDLATE